MDREWIRFPRLINATFERLEGQLDPAALFKGPAHIGEFSSAVEGLGIQIKRSGDTAAFRVYADDGGEVLYDTGSVPDLRAGLSRMLLTEDDSGGDIRIHGFMGQLKAYDALWNDEVASGVNGRLEIVRSAATLTLGGNGVSAGVLGIVNTEGAITVNTNHVLAGVAAISDFKATLTQTGIVAGIFVGKYDTTNWSDATARTTWGYGMYIPNGAATIPIQIGQSSSSAVVGHSFSATAKRAIAVFTDDGNAVYGADADGIYSRSVVLHAQNGAYAVNAGRSHLRVVASLTPSGSKGFYGHLGYMEASGTYTIGDGTNFTILGALGASVETGGTPTIAANAVVCGLHISGKTLPASPTGEAVGILFQAITQGYEHTFGFTGVGSTDGNGLVAQSGGTNTYTHKIAVWINGVGTKYIGVGDIA